MPIHYARSLTGSSRSTAADRHLGYVLAAMAGAINAIGFGVLRHYTSHMTGMVTTLGERLVDGDLLLAAAAGLAIATFVAGAACCTLMIHSARRHRLHAEFALPLLLESLVVLAVAFQGPGAARSGAQAWATICALTFAMGLQNALITKISRGEIRTTHVTGIVTDLGIEWGRALVRRLDPHTHAGIPGRAGLLATLLLAFAAGCVGGTFAVQHVGLLALLPVAIAIGIAALVPAIDDLSRRAHAKPAPAPTDTPAN